jgi:hypothetical protein
MHSAQELRSSDFRVVVGSRDARLADLFDGFGEHDRLGVVLRSPCGAVGASALITATITAFYDLQRARADDFFIYPDYFLFHVGRPLGDHARLDIWPRHKEVVVPEDVQGILDAVNDRAITRLVVEDGEARHPELQREALASARARIRTCLAYSATGRVRDADVRIASNPVTESYVNGLLDPEARLVELRTSGNGRLADAVEARAAEVTREERQRIRKARADLVDDDVPVESYRRISLDEALGLLQPGPSRFAG